MATTGSNFVQVNGSTAALVGSTVTTPPFLSAVAPYNAYSLCEGTTSLALDRVFFDSGATVNAFHSGAYPLPFGTLVGGFAKNGAMIVTFTGTTAVTVDFTNLAAAVGVTSYAAGDATLTTLNYLLIRNISATASTITVAPGGSNPLTFPLALAGTTPTIAMLKDDIFPQYAAIGKTVDATHKNVLFTPTAGGALFIAIGGA